MTYRRGGVGSLYLKNKKYRQALDAYTRVIKSQSDAYAYVIYRSLPGWAEIINDYLKEARWPGTASKAIRFTYSGGL